MLGAEEIVNRNSSGSNSSEAKGHNTLKNQNGVLKTVSRNKHKMASTKS